MKITKFNLPPTSPAMSSKLQKQTETISISIRSPMFYTTYSATTAVSFLPLFKLIKKCTTLTLFRNLNCRTCSGHVGSRRLYRLKVYTRWKIIIERSQATNTYLHVDDTEATTQLYLCQKG